MNKPKSVTIIGGGSSAWLTAAYLKNNTNYSITVIDKEDGKNIGVGEATTRGFIEFLSECGFKKSQWFKEIEATYKSGIYFPNFGKDKDVWHPFLLSLPNEEYSSNLYEALTYNKERIYKDLPFQDISLKNEVNFTSLEHYAYHIDCTKLVNFIKNNIDVNFINSEVVEIDYTESLIEKIKLKSEKYIKSDLYIDCTGFKQILGNNKDRVDTTNRLFCDTAVAGHVEYNDKEKEFKPYVTSSAVDHGWIWNIPIQSRMGSGLVFNRTITSIETAKEYLINYYPDNKVTNLKVIDWTPYYLKRQWKGNIVNIGLSSGFVEPLESTGLMIIMESIKLLVRNLQDGSVEKFNNKMVDNYEDVIDFINMHYQYSNIISDFWNYVRGNIISSHKTEHYKNILKYGIKIDDSVGNNIFDNGSWICWMLQCEDIIIENKNIDKDRSIKILNEYNKTYCNRKTIVKHIDYVLKTNYL